MAGPILLAAPPRRVLRRCHPFASTAPSWTASWCSVQFLVRGPSGRRRLNVPGALDAVTPELATAINDTVVNPEVAREWLLELSARHVGLSVTLVLADACYQRCEVIGRLAQEPRIEQIGRAHV